jgi:hypothetical protein
MRTDGLLRAAAKACRFNSGGLESKEIAFDGKPLAIHSERAALAPGGFVKIRIQSLSFLATLAVVLGMISWGSALNAQTTPSTPSDQQAPPPDTPPASQQPPSAQTPDQSQTPDSSAGVPSASDTQTFSGTVVKSGDKYMLKTDSGKTYDIDHQDDVKKFDGKRVRVQGKLDDSGTKILVK